MRGLVALAIGCGGSAVAIDGAVDVAPPCTAPVPMFGAPMANPVPGARGVAVGDLDGNNSRDLAVATGSDVVVMFNDSRGTFTPAQPLRFARVPADNVLIADVDNDAHNDVLWWTDGVLSVNRHVPASDVAFLPAEAIPMTIPVAAVFATQLDDAGAADLVITDGSTTTQLLRSNGGTSFTVTDMLPGAAIGHADVDGDGNQDVLLVAGGRAVVAFGDGSGAIAATVEVGVAAASFAPGVFAAGPNPSLVVADASGALSLVPQPAPRTFGAPSLLDTHVAGPLQVLDVNGDLRTDVAGNGTLVTQCVDGVTAPQPFGIASPAATQLIDITVDGKPDIVQRDATGVFVSIEE